MKWLDDGPESGPSDDDIAEAHRLRVLHRRSASPVEDACLWCREAWPCWKRQWSNEIFSAAGADGLEQVGPESGGRHDAAVGGPCPARPPVPDAGLG